MRLIFGWLLCLLALPIQAGPGRDALDRFTTGLESLEARFEQSVLDTENSRQGLFHGVFLLQRPDRFRWDYLAPEEKHIIADGRDLWMVDVELNQVTQVLQSMALKNTPATVLLSSQPLDASFKVVELGERQQLQWLELIPREPESNILRILLAFKGDQLLRLETTDNFGQISRFSFFEIRRNPEIPEQRFEYQPPFGWDVFTREAG